MKLSIIIPTKDRVEILNRTVENLIEATKGIDAEIIIVNDSNHDINLEISGNNLFIIKNQKSGAASARNYGVNKATGELLLFLDDDIIVNSSNISKTLFLHRNSVKIAYNFFWIYPPDLIEVLNDTNFGRYVLNNFLFTNSYRVKIEGKVKDLLNTNGLTSQYFSILKSDFLKSGGYDEEIPFAGIEDLILFKLLNKNDISVLLSTADLVLQNESDRISLFSVMERQRRGAVTVRKAFSLGHTEMKIDFSVFRKFIFNYLVFFKMPIYRMTMALPNRKIVNNLYFKLVNLLLSLSSFEGYFKSETKIIYKTRS